MLVHQSYRYELKPNNKEKSLLSKHAGCARFAYNWGLSQRIEEYKIKGKSSNAIAQHRQLNILKKTQFPWMYQRNRKQMPNILMEYLGRFCGTEKE